MDLKDLQRQTSFPMPGTRKILARPVAPAKPIVLEEQDSGYKSNDQVEVKTIRQNTHK
jgi:hypothetical protein